MRTLSVSLAALCLVVCAAPAVADVGVTMNLFYNDPLDANSGGTWEVAVVSLDPTESVVGVSAVMGGIDDPSGVVTVPSGLGNYVEDPSYPGYPPVFSDGSGYQIGYVQGPFPSGYLGGVGLPGFANAVADPFGNPAWDDQTVVLTSGSFSPGSTPFFTTVSNDDTEVNVWLGDGYNVYQAEFAVIDGVQSPVVRSNLVPEPASGGILALGLVVLGLRRRQK